MDGVIEMANVDYPHGHTNEGDDLEDRQSEGMCETLVGVRVFQCVHSLNITHLGELLPELVQFLLQRSLLLLGGGHLVTDLTDLSGHASCHGDTSGPSRSDIGALDRVLKRVGTNQWVGLSEIPQHRHLWPSDIHGSKRMHPVSHPLTFPLNN